MREHQFCKTQRCREIAAAGRQHIRVVLLTVVAVIAASPVVRVQPQSSSGSSDALTGLLVRTAGFVARFEQSFSHVVAEERYEQDVIPATRTFVGGPRAQHRELVSDFLLVRLAESDDWVPFRDVFEVDGARLRDHDDRLVKLFVNASGSSADRAADITDESARYNIGIVRTVNHPLLALQVVRAGQQARFRFSGLQADTSAGPNAALIEYREQSSPTVVHGPGGRDMPMNGRLWIETTTGAILRTEVRIDAVGVSAIINTRFELDPAFDAPIPVELREDYRQPNGTRVTGTATYRKFRAFHVDVNYGRGQ